EPPASKVLNQWLASCDCPQVSLSSVPAWIDAGAGGADRGVARPGQGGRGPAAPSGGLACTRRLGRWAAAERRAEGPLRRVPGGHDVSEPYVARVLPSLLPNGAQLVVSSSMPIRDVEWFGIVPEGVTVRANRGANGIDGVVATAIGVAAASGAPIAVLLGDI